MVRTVEFHRANILQKLGGEKHSRSYANRAGRLRITSVNGTKRTCSAHARMSAFGGRADIKRKLRKACFMTTRTSRSRAIAGCLGLGFNRWGKRLETS